MDTTRFVGGLALALAALASLSACEDRPGGLPYLSRASCEAEGGVVVEQADAGAEASCGSDSLVLGRIDPDESEERALLCCG